MTRDGPTSDARILIIDDTPGNVRLLERVLATGGYAAVRSTTDARHAIALVDEFRPDLILLDLPMPHLDGHEVLARVRARAAPHAYLPVIVLTGDATVAMMNQAIAGGATDVVTKPFE